MRESNLIYGAYPAFLANDLKTIFEKVALTGDLTISPSSYSVKTCGEVVCIPERIYYDEPALAYFMSLTPLESLILQCLFTRHHDGFIREKYLRQLLPSVCNHSWMIPYVMRLIGEYVIEILEVIYTNLHLFNKDEIKQFIIENSEFYKTTKQRVASYWDCYYRLKFPRKEDYVGFKILDYFES